jgi:hypothetical protein
VDASWHGHTRTSERTVQWLKDSCQSFVGDTIQGVAASDMKEHHNTGGQRKGQRKGKAYKEANED